MDQSFTHLHIAAYGKDIRYHWKQLTMHKYLRESNWSRRIKIPKIYNELDIRPNSIILRYQFCIDEGLRHFEVHTLSVDNVTHIVLYTLDSYFRCNFLTKHLWTFCHVIRVTRPCKIHWQTLNSQIRDIRCVFS